MERKIQYSTKKPSSSKYTLAKLFYINASMNLNSEELKGFQNNFVKKIKQTNKLKRVEIQISNNTSRLKYQNII